MRIIVKILFFILLVGNLNGQTQYLNGIIIDSLTSEPLAFVNIVYNDNNQGTITNIDGKFSLKRSSNIQYLKIYYMGYKQKVVPYEEFKNKHNITIRLSQNVLSINEVQVFPGVNPAHRIIRLAQQNRKKNDPESLDSYSYDNYNKMIFTGSHANKSVDYDTVPLPDSVLVKLKEKKQTEKDTADAFNNFFGEQHIMIMETVSERYFKAPDKIQEKVIANRVSGLKNPTFIILATQFQSFSFYNNHITVMGKSYLNPISDGSTSKYLFILEDTLYDQNSDTIFVISFRPKRGKNFTGLKGTLHINTNGYAIQSVIAEPYENVPTMRIKIQQKYELIDNKQWFPVELNSNILFSQLQMLEYRDTTYYKDSLAIIESESIPVIGIGKSYISSIKINPELDSISFNHIEVMPEKDINKKDDTFWEKHRPIPLDNADKKTYEVIDSIGEKYNLDQKLKLVETLAIGKIPVSIFDINILKLMTYNQQEGYRLCLDASTNDKLTKYVSVGGYFAYGFKDKKTKYGGYLTIPFSIKHETNLKVSAWTDVFETGRIKFLEDKNLLATEYYRDIFVKTLHLSDGGMIEFNTRAFRYLRANLYLKSERLSDSYMRYNYMDSENTQLAYNHQGYLLLDNVECGIKLKYYYKEKFFVTPKGNKLSLGTKYPGVFLNISKGLDILSSDIEYLKAEVKINKSFEWKLLGKTNFQIVAGATDRPLPAWLTYNGNGSYTNFSIEAANSFGTMRMNEFMNDQFVYFYIRHDFGSILFKTKHFEPKIVLCQNFGYGTQSHPEYHYNTGIPMDKGYYESGILINNLLKQSFFGYGVGVFYRYGPYSLSDQIDNFSFKLTLYSSFD